MSAEIMSFTVHSCLETVSAEKKVEICDLTYAIQKNKLILKSLTIVKMTKNYTIN